MSSNTIVFTRQIESDAIYDSTLVDEVYYDDNTRDLYVDLNDNVYKYTGVPAEVVDKFESADSAGSFYNTDIKRVFGPGLDLGHWTALEYEEVKVETKTQFAPTSISTGSLITSGELVLSGGVVGGTVNPNTFSLKPFTDVKVEGIEREYVVTFEVSGILDHKRHTLKAKSVDEAVQSVLDLGKMLDLNFIVREVCIRFE